METNSLNSNEIIFLKFMQNKPTDESFSPRWEFQYKIKPEIEIDKLVKLNYLEYNCNWKDNIKKATLKELNDILQNYNLKVTGKKDDLIKSAIENIDNNVLAQTFNKTIYILTDKGKYIIEKNKKLFMTDREKSGKAFEELTDKEYNFLKNHHKTTEYKELKNSTYNFEKGYLKYDILWSIYNQLILKYSSKKDYFNCFLVYQQMSTQLFNESKYEQATQFFILALYIRIYEIAQECIETGFDTNMMYERHISKYHKDLKKYMEKANININDTDDMCAFVRKIIIHYLPQLVDDYWIYWLSFKYIGKS